VQISSTDSDIDEISRASVLAWQESYSHIMQKSFLANLKWEDRAAKRANSFVHLRKTTFVAVLKINKNIIGFCDVGPARPNESIDKINNSVGEIFTIYILSKHQKNGLGRELFNMSCGFLKSHGYTELVIWTLVENKDAISFYTDMGCVRRPWHKQIKIGGIEYSEIAFSYLLN
jgi:ribosomal protein S18 acetylase RimI-like enzyme